MKQCQVVVSCPVCGAVPADPMPCVCCADDAGSVSSSSGVGSSGAGPSVDKLRWDQAYSGPDLSATIRQLKPAHRYLLRVRAINETGASHWSPTLAATTVAAAPCQPARLSAAAEGSSSMSVTWQPPEVDNGAPVTAYHLEMQAARGAGSGWANVWQGSKLTHTVGGLLPGRKYSWRVRAANACGSGPWSEAVTASTAPAVPGASSKPSISKVTATSAKVKWSIPLEDNGAAVRTYHVHLRQVQGQRQGSAADGGSSDAESVGSSGGEWLEVYAGPLLDTTVTKLQPGSSYELRVAAANSVGLGPWSPSAELATPLRPPPPPADLAAVVDESASGHVAVSWQQPEPGADSAAAVSVLVEAMGPGSKEAAARGTVPVGEGSQAVLQGLKPGVGYQIRARSVGAGSTGHSAWCDAVSVAMPAAPAPADDAAAALVLHASVEAGKRAGKGKGGKAGAGKAAAKGDEGGGEVQQRKAVRPKRGVLIVEDTKSARTVPKPQTVGSRIRKAVKKVRKHPMFTWAVLALILVVTLFVVIRRKMREQQEQQPMLLETVA